MKRGSIPDTTKRRQRMPEPRPHCPYCGVLVDVYETSIYHPPYVKPCLHIVDAIEYHKQDDGSFHYVIHGEAWGATLFDSRDYPRR